MTASRRVVVITGAGGALGAAISHKLAGEPDTDLVLSDVSAPSLEATVAGLPGNGGGVETTLADVTGAFFNGADLNLDSLIPSIEQLGILPAGMNIENLDFAFGGLLTPGDTAAGVGGSIFNSLGIDLTGVPAIGTLEATSQPVGPLGAMEGWDQTIAALLGWDGSGSPLADVTLPTIPADFLDGSTIPAAAAADLSSLVQEVVTALGL